MLNPRCVNNLTDVKTLHEIETVDTRTIINEIVPNNHQKYKIAYIPFELVAD